MANNCGHSECFGGCRFDKFGTQRVDPNAEQIRRWIDSGRCCFCGSKQKDSSKCICRFCDECVTTWISSYPAEYSEVRDGLKPKYQLCPECAYDAEQEAKGRNAA